MTLLSGAQRGNASGEEIIDFVDGVTSADPA